MTRNLIAIVGPTATGKTSLAVELARRFGGIQTDGRPPEIIGADSRQVYRHMDIGTAKPTPEERSRARHQLIDVVDPDEPFSLGQWLELAQAALGDVWSRGRQPLLVGGTGQYVWALLEGWRVPRVPPQPEFRRRMEGRDGAALFEEVRRIDPLAAERIGPRNRRRLIRALEVYEETGRPISYWQAKEPPEFGTLLIGLRLPRDELYRRIDERVERMIAAGLIEEARRLLAMGYSRELPSMSGIGYKEACAHLAGEMTLDEAAARIKTETHRLARHQNAWFKADDPRIRWLDAGECVLEEAARLVGEWMGTNVAQARR
ncbi:MAG: tRNA (adenosine(37)-N6)-dimethylallyltransferase MiaA [Chloroflexi bacterium]|nr:tRNA (adenosine(37)-N6)-dimethylallyltransferase MiaA [Chloroflexota bacterium]